jgi:hypothetical protein
MVKEEEITLPNGNVVTKDKFTYWIVSHYFRRLIGYEDDFIRLDVYSKGLSALSPTDAAYIYLEVF